LLVVAQYDEIVPARFPLELARRWQGVPVLRYPHGHISINMSARMRQEVAARVGELLGGMPEPAG